MANIALYGGLDTYISTASEINEIAVKPKFLSLNVPELKLFFPLGLQRGSLVEIVGHKCSGKTSTSLYVLAESIRKGETCAYIDLHNQFDPASLANNGVTLNQLSWVRCQGNTVHAMRSTDLLLHAGGFGVVLLDLSGASPQTLNSIPLSYWFRFRQAVEDTPTILLVCGEHPQARSCSASSLQIKAKKVHWAGEAPSFLLGALESSGVPRRAQKANVTSIRPESLLIQTSLVQSSGV